MSTAKKLAEQLGISVKTISNQKKLGYELVLNDSGKVLLDESVQAYVKHQSEIIRKMKAQKGRDTSGNSGNSQSGSDLQNVDDWKMEKEKQAAIKIRLQNEKDMGELIPVDAMIELYNSPLSLVKSKLVDLSNQIQKRIPLNPEQVKLIDEVVSDSLNALNEKGEDELSKIISQIIERYSKYYSSADEDGYNNMGNYESES